MVGFQMQSNVTNILFVGRVWPRLCCVTRDCSLTLASPTTRSVSSLTMSIVATETWSRRELLELILVVRPLTASLTLMIPLSATNTSTATRAEPLRCLAPHPSSSTSRLEAVWEKHSWARRLDTATRRTSSWRLTASVAPVQRPLVPRACCRLILSTHILLTADLILHATLER